jgi:hypothetical protein
MNELIEKIDKTLKPLKCGKPSLLSDKPPLSSLKPL